VEIVVCVEENISKNPLLRKIFEAAVLRKIYFETAI
jgi:hypothetical protein